jgi:hypothetical protein
MVDFPVKLARNIVKHGGGRTQKKIMAHFLSKDSKGNSEKQDGALFR